MNLVPFFGDAMQVGKVLATAAASLAVAAAFTVPNIPQVILCHPKVHSHV
jgi:hypothetical protein